MTPHLASKGAATRCTLGRARTRRKVIDRYISEQGIDLDEYLRRQALGQVPWRDRDHPTNHPLVRERTHP